MAMDTPGTQVAWRVAGTEGISTKLAVIAVVVGDPSPTLHGGLPAPRALARADADAVHDPAAGLHGGLPAPRALAPGCRGSGTARYDVAWRVARTEGISTRIRCLDRHRRS